MTNLQKLIDEITSLEIKISGFENVFSLEHYSQTGNKQENLLRQLNARALTEIINLTDEQIKRQITRLEAEHEKLKRLKIYFHEQYNMYFHGTGFDADEFINLLSRYLIIIFPERKLNNVITKEFMFCLSDAITFKAMYLIGFINTVKEQAQASETKATEPPPAETLSEKITRKLETLKGAFEDTGHIDKIIEALAEYAEGTTPDCVQNEKYNCKNIKFSSKDFYTPFKGLNKTIGLTVEKIAEVLHYFIHANDGSQNVITISAIEQNIKRKYPKVI